MKKTSKPEEEVDRMNEYAWISRDGWTAITRDWVPAEEVHALLDVGDLSAEEWAEVDAAGGWDEFTVLHEPHIDDVGLLHWRMCIPAGGSMAEALEEAAGFDHFDEREGLLQGTHQTILDHARGCSGNC